MIEYDSCDAEGVMWITGLKRASTSARGTGPDRSGVGARVSSSENASPPDPRERRPSLLPRGYMWALGLALFIGGMAVSVGAPADARTARYLADHGVHTTATVTGVDENGGGSRSNTTFLDLEFKDEFGLSEGARFGYCDDRSWEIGDRVDIIYNSDDPTEMHFADCDYPTQETVAFFIGVAALALGTFVTLRAWRSSGWKLRRAVGIPLVILGVLFIGTAYSEDCNCRELAYTGAGMIVIGAVAQFGRSDPAVGARPPGSLGEPDPR